MQLISKVVVTYIYVGTRGGVLPKAWDAVPRKILLVGRQLNPRSEIGDHRKCLGF